MISIDSITLEVSDPAAARAFYADAFGLGEPRLRVRASEAPSDGFRGFTLSLVVAQPSTVEALVGAALDGGASTLKAPKKSFWGHGGVVRAPDGTIWKIATSARRDSGPATREIDDVVLLLGAGDIGASKRFYVEHGFAVAKSFPGRYVQFEAAPGGVTLALYGRKALAKDAGVAPEGSGSHRLAIGAGGGAGAFSDPDGFASEPAAAGRLTRA